MKKAIVLVLLLALMLSLAACGGNNTPPANNSTTPPANSSSPAVNDNTASSTPSSGENPSDSQPEEPTFTDGEWPDNEYTQQVPKPSLTIGKVSDEFLVMNILEIHFANATYDSMNDYRNELREFGFNNDENDTMESSTDTIVWNAQNSSGWLVRMGYSESRSSASIQIQKP